MRTLNKAFFLAHFLFLFLFLLFLLLRSRPASLVPAPSLHASSLLPAPPPSLLPSFLSASLPSQVAAAHNGDRVAVCFTGLTRSLRNHTFSSIRTYLLGRLIEQNLTADVFLHTYLVHSIDNPRSGEQHVPLDLSEWRLLEPLRFEVENQSIVDTTLNFADVERYGNPWKDDPTGKSLKNLVRMLRSLGRCWQLVQNYTRETGISYRYVMFARPDVRYLPPGLPNLAQYYLESKNPLRIGLSFEDRFAVGTADAVQVWANRASFAREYMTHTQKTRPLHSESLVRFAMEKQNITAIAVPVCFVRVRANGNVHGQDEKDCRLGRWSSSPWRHAKPP